MNLIVDIGNTRAKYVVFDNDEPLEECFDSNESLEGLHDFASRYPVSHAIVSTVVRLTPRAKACVEGLHLPTIWLTSNTPLPGKMEFPPSMGADRIAAIIYAVVRNPEQASLVIDAGTCITYEIIDEQGRYRGGNIAPGAQMRLLAMHEHTSLLPMVGLKGESPELGYDTQTAMRSGVVRGIQHEIEGYIAHYRKKYPSLKVFLTGGDHFEFDNTTRKIIYADKFIVPRGLNCILDYNIKK